MTQSGQHLKLRDICTLLNGRAYSKAELLTEGKYPVLRVGNFFTSNRWYYSDMNLDADKYCEAGDLLYAWSASFGPRIWSGEKVIYHYHIWKVVPDETIADRKYLFHFFNWDKEKIKQDQGAGSTMIHVSKGSMENREMFVPSLHEQRRIVSILDEAFEGIATAKANAERNVANARALFDSYLDSVLRTEENSWKSVALGAIAEFRNGVNFTKNSKGESIRIVGVKDFKGNLRAPLESTEWVTTDGEIPSTDLLRENDILFVRSNGSIDLIGRCLLVGEVSDRIVHSGFTIRARLQNEFVSPQFLAEFLRAGRTRQKLIDSGIGTNIKSLNQGSLAALQIPYPSQSEQSSVVNRIKAIRRQIGQLESIMEQKLAALDTLKKSLLHRAFTGQL